MLYETTGAVFRRWRDAAALSHGEIQRRTGLSLPCIADLMAGRVAPRPETLAAVLGALGRTEEDLLRALGDAVEGA